MYRVDVFRATLDKVVRLLTQFTIPFHLTGGITSVAYGEPRMTQDIDLVVGNAALAVQLETFIDAATAEGFLLDDRSIRIAVEKGTIFQLFDMQEALKVDIYPREMIPGELGRSRMLEIFAGVQLPVVSRTDAAASKLMWIHKGSQKSRRDLRQIVRLLTTSERSALDQFAESFELSRLLSEVLAESDEIDS
ncbi:MAG: nucleotidyl transferase AbiEii/AbiGii toxin family protein [Planctomycetota bacterium]